MNIDLRLGDCIEVLKTIPDNSIDSIVTDPPYGIGFMGKAWDTFQPSNVNEAVEEAELSYKKTKEQKQDNPNLKGRKNAPIGSKSTFAGTYDLSDKGKNDYQQWCYEWGKECLRVLKPGGHLLASNSPRMYHRMAIGLEDAGFEIRDQIMWVYGSGFPKSLNIGKAIDKKQGIISHSILELKQIIIDYFNRKNITKKKFDELCGFRAANYMRTEHREDDGWGESIPTNEKWIKMKEVLGIDTTEYDELFFSAQREVVGKGSSGIGKAFGKDGWVSETMEFDITEAKNDAAKEWEGWGTALKPAHEPIVLARKPLSEKSIAENVLKHGTGGINIDGSRIEFENEDINFNTTQTGNVYAGNSLLNSQTERTTTHYKEEGRWPANIIFDEEAGKLLDEQSGISKSNPRTICDRRTNSNHEYGFKTDAYSPHNDKGGASRFFYCPKASKKDRGENNNHPTVKPTDLMRYLINLITPPNGTILDPFMGSGSTGKAAVRCGVNFIGIEKEEEYMKIAKARIDYERNKPIQQKLL